MKEKRVVSRTVAVGLEILCGILAIGLIASVVFYTSTLNSTIADKDAQISSLTSEKKTLQSQLDTLRSEIANLQNQLDQLTSGTEPQTDIESIQAQLGYLQFQPIPQSSTSQGNRSDQQSGEELSPVNHLQIISVNFTYDEGYMLDRLVITRVTNVVVRNFGETAVTVTSLKLYYSGELQASEAVSVLIPSNSTRNISVNLAPGHWGSAGGNYYFVTVETSKGYTATSDPILLLGIPPNPPLG